MLLLLRKPVEIVEQDAINSLVDANKISYLPAVAAESLLLFRADHLKGCMLPLSIKTSQAALLAEELDADMLIILTAVEKVAVNFGKDRRKMAG